MGRYGENQKIMNILMIMFGRGVGGAELQFIELANYLANNHKVRLLSLGGDGAINNASIDDRIDIQVYEYNNVIGTLVSLSKAFFVNVGFSSDHIITTSFIGNVFGFLLCLFRKRRLVSLQTVSKSMRCAPIDRVILRRFNALIAGATDIKDYLLSYGQDPDKIHVIHNWVDVSKRVPSANVYDTRRKLDIEKDQLIIGCIGRLHPQKGQVYLIQAYAELISEFPNSKLLLIGDGPSKEVLEEEVNRLGIADSVIFTGTISGDDYNNYLSVIDVYVQPSVFEGLPRTLLDAMCMGKAIVATDINGNREAIENGINGLLVRSENVQEISLALARLLRSPEDRETLASQAVKSANNKFSMENSLKKIEKLSLDLL